jgi:hypothetical protein
VIRGLNFGICLEDLSLFVDQVGDSPGVSRLGVIARAVGEAEFAASIAKQWKRKAEFLCESAVGRSVIEARSEDLDLLFGELSGPVTEPFAFDRSARGVGLGIKPEEDLPAAEILERERLPLMADDREIGRGLTRIEHLHTSAVDGIET